MSKQSMFDRDIELLKIKAKAVRVVLSPTLSAEVLQGINDHRESILACSDVAKILDYIDKATDAECLCALSEMYLSAPLNDEFYGLFTFLAAKVFSDAGLEVPEDISEAADGLELTEKQKHELESFRRGIRVSQQRTFANELAQ